MYSTDEKCLKLTVVVGKRFLITAKTASDASFLFNLLKLSHISKCFVSWMTIWNFFELIVWSSNPKIVFSVREVGIPSVASCVIAFSIDISDDWLSKRGTTAKPDEICLIFCSSWPCFKDCLSIMKNKDSPLRLSREDLKVLTPKGKFELWYDKELELESRTRDSETRLLRERDFWGFDTGGSPFCIKKSDKKKKRKRKFVTFYNFNSFNLFFFSKF